MLLEGRNAVIYGGGGSIGAAVAEAFAREGTRVHLAGRTVEPLESVAAQLRSAGGTAETAVVDALDEDAVEAHAEAVTANFGSLDISFKRPIGRLRTPLCDRPPEPAAGPGHVDGRASVIGHVFLGDHAVRRDSHKELARHRVALPELLGPVLAHVPRADGRCEPEQLVEVLVDGDAPAHMHKRVRGPAVIDAQGNPRVAP